MALPSDFSFYSLNWPTMTEMKRFMTKKVVTKMKLMKRSAIHWRLSMTGCRSGYDWESMAANMISGQVSSVLTSKKVIIDENTLS